MATNRSYRGVSAADRRAARRTAFIDAALDCLHEGGFAAVGVRAVCSRARLTPRYFYENFVDIDELLVAAIDAASEQVTRATLEALAAADPDPASQVRAAVATGFGVVVDDPRAASAFLVAAAGHGPMRERRHEIVEHYAGLVVANLEAFDAGDREQARATALFLMGGTIDVFEALLAGRVTLSRERVVDLLSGMWLGALGSAGGSAAGDSAAPDSGSGAVG